MSRRPSRSCARAADGARARGPALGRRGDARRAEPARPADRGGPGARRRDATATTSSTARHRCASCSASSRRARRAGSSFEPLSPRGGRAAGRAARARRRRAVPRDRRQPVLRHRGARGRRATTSRRRCATRCSPGPRGSAAAAPAAARSGRVVAAAGRALAARRARRRGATRLDECLASGMLGAAAGGVAFRHELARARGRGVARPRTGGRACTARALARCARGGVPTSPGSPTTPRRPATPTAVLRYAPAAAARAAALGAHREAAAQYARALRFADGLPLERAGRPARAALDECYLTDQIDEAIAAQEQALELPPGARRPARRGRRLRWLSRRLWCAGPDRRGAEARGGEAVALLEALPPGRELALAYAQPRAAGCMNDERRRRGASTGASARSSSPSGSATPRSSSSLNNSARSSCSPARAGGPTSWSEPGAAPARPGSTSTSAGPTSTSPGPPSRTARVRRSPSASSSAGIAYCARAGLEPWRLYLLAYRRPRRARPGRWDEAADGRRGVLARSARPSPLLRILALIVLGLRPRPARRPGAVAAARRGARARPSRPASCSGSAPVAAARAEAAWLDGRARARRGRRPRRRSRSPPSADAAWASASWRTGCAGRPARRGARGRRRAVRARSSPATAGARPRAGGARLPLRGGARARRLRRRGRLRRALAELQRLGAAGGGDRRPPAARARRPRPAARAPAATRENPAGLTARELEVLALRRRRACATRRSPRGCSSRRRRWITTSRRSCASSDVRTRGEASAEAARLGIAQDR